MSDTTIYEPSLNTNPPRNRFTFLRRSCPKIENCTDQYSSQSETDVEGAWVEQNEVVGHVEGVGRRAQGVRFRIQG